MVLRLLPTLRQRLCRVRLIMDGRTSDETTILVVLHTQLSCKKARSNNFTQHYMTPIKHLRLRVQKFEKEGG